MNRQVEISITRARQVAATDYEGAAFRTSLSHLSKVLNALLTEPTASSDQPRPRLRHQGIRVKAFFNQAATNTRWPGLDLIA